MRPSDGKILDRQQLAGMVAELKGQGHRIVFTNGCFDLLHTGHIRYLNEARTQGNLLVVAVNADDSLRRVKGLGRPVLPASQRKRVLAGLECVDFVTEFGEDTPHAILRELRPDILVKGGDYPIEGVVAREVVEGYGGKVMTLNLTQGQSTTSIIDKILG